jgi:hypothetical protein
MVMRKRSGFMEQNDAVQPALTRRKVLQSYVAPSIVVMSMTATGTFATSGRTDWGKSGKGKAKGKGKAYAKANGKS